MTSFFCLQHPAPHLSRLQSWAGILFIIFCRASHAIFIKRRKGKVRGSVCKRGDKRRKQSYLHNQCQCRKKDGSWGANLFGLSQSNLIPWVSLFQLLLEHLRMEEPANTPMALPRGKTQHSLMTCYLSSNEESSTSSSNLETTSPGSVPRTGKP